MRWGEASERDSAKDVLPILKGKHSNVLGSTLEVPLDRDPADTEADDGEEHHVLALKEVVADDRSRWPIRFGSHCDLQVGEWIQRGGPGHYLS